MDAFATADRVIEQNDVSNAQTEAAAADVEAESQAKEDNKFQKAISSWRGMFSCGLPVACYSMLMDLGVLRHRPGQPHPEARRQCLRDRSASAGLARSTERSSAENEGLPQARRCGQTRRVQGLVEG
jgi:hypothetical protein